MKYKVYILHINKNLVQIGKTTDCFIASNIFDIQETIGNLVSIYGTPTRIFVHINRNLKNHDEICDKILNIVKETF